MALLESINIQSMVLERTEEGISWAPKKGGRAFHNVPHIFFNDGEPWLAANQYALSKLQGISGNDIKTVRSIMGHLKAYASWLEDKGVDWRNFPIKKKDRCIFQFRGYLIDQRNSDLIAPSTATARMAAVVQFYRWAQVEGLIERKDMWEDRTKSVKFYTTVGLSRTMSVTSSELSIPNRTRQGLTLEGGLLPVSVDSQAELLQFLRSRGMVELYLMHLVGFFTGARSGTIRTLRLSSLENSLDDPQTPQVKRIAVGPPTKVKTKFDVSGYLLVPSLLVEELERYAYSARRLIRQEKASEDDVTLLFLTERGNGYSETSFTKLISDMRERLVNAGLPHFKDYCFHQTRATYGTMLMKYAMNTLPSQTDALVFVRDAMLHKDEATTWKYIKFIEKEPIKEKLSDEFFNLFTGDGGDAEALIDQVTYDAP